MRKCVICMGLVLALLLAGGCRPPTDAEPQIVESIMPEETPQASAAWESVAPAPVKEAPPGYADVREYGAVGDAVLHHPMGVRGGGQSEYTGWYWAGHFVHLVTETYHELYQGDPHAGMVEVYEVIPDGAQPAPGQISLSDVHPGPDYTPSVGDRVVQYEAANPEESIYAAEDSAAFENAIAASGGRLYLPEGDYLVSQLTAAKITELAGPGRIWLKEWRGGVLWYLIYGWSELAEYQGYGWIDAAHFHDAAWRSMHWLSCVPQVNGWESSADFAGDGYSARIEYPFDETRENVNIWITIEPTVPEELFPDEITVCIGKDMAAYYSLRGAVEWSRATEGGVEGGMFHSSWNGRSRALPEGAWKDCGEWIEATIPREAFFRELQGEESSVWFLHCWSQKNANLSSADVEFTKSYARIWVKDAQMEGYLMGAIGGDMRSAYGDRLSQEYYIHEAYYSARQYLASQPQEFYAYNLPDGQFDAYFPAG